MVHLTLCLKPFEFEQLVQKINHVAGVKEESVKAKKYFTANTK